MIRELYDVFEHQRELMDALAPKEEANGYTPPTPPLDLQDRGHQQHFRMMAWFLTEEVVEAIIAKEDEYPEELSDVLHFMVELCILADVSPEAVLATHTTLDNHPDLLDVLIQVGKATNMLKAKPWKSNPQPTDEAEFQRTLRYGLAYLLRFLKIYDLDFHRVYFLKNGINKQRLQNGY